MMKMLIYSQLSSCHSREGGNPESIPDKY